MRENRRQRRGVDGCTGLFNGRRSHQNHSWRLSAQPQGKWITVSSRLRETDHNFRFWNFVREVLATVKGKHVYIRQCTRAGAEMARLPMAGANVMVTDILEDEGHALANDKTPLWCMMFWEDQCRHQRSYEESLWWFGYSGE